MFETANWFNCLKPNMAVFPGIESGGHPIQSVGPLVVGKRFVAENIAWQNRSMDWFEGFPNRKTPIFDESIESTWPSNDSNLDFGHASSFQW